MSPWSTEDTSVSDGIPTFQVSDSKVTAEERSLLTQPSKTTTPKKMSTLEDEMRKMGRRGQWRRALSLLNGIEAPDEAQFRAAIEACERAQEARQALNVYGMMIEAGIKPSPVSHISRFSRNCMGIKS